MHTIIPRRRPTKHDPSPEESLAGHVWRATNIIETPTKKMPRPPETSPLPKLQSSGPLQDTPPLMPISHFVPLPTRCEPPIMYHFDKRQSPLKAVQNAIIDALSATLRTPTHIYLSENNCREYQYETTNLHMASRHYMIFVDGRVVRIPVSFDARFSSIPDSIVVCAFD